jgi:HEPN domain-containing protein
MAISSQAEYFLNAYHILVRNKQELQDLRKQRAHEHNVKHPDKNHVQEIGYATDQQTGVADFVCLAFSVELYLKAVFEVLGKKQRGHNIRKLFEKLPDDAQKQIFNIQMKNVYQTTLDHYKERMDIISDGFEKFRYSYEHQSLTYHKSFALEMIKAMKQFISDTRKTKA